MNELSNIKVTANERSNKIAFVQQQLNMLQQGEYGLYAYHQLEQLRTILKRRYQDVKEKWQEDHFGFTTGHRLISRFMYTEEFILLEIHERNGIFCNKRVFQFINGEYVDWKIINGIVLGKVTFSMNHELL